MGSIVVLLHLDGVDGSTVFPDLSGKVWTAAAHAQIDTAQSKFGGASVLFDTGQDDAIWTPDHDDFNFGTGDFTVECWARHNGGPRPSYEHYVSQSDAFILYKEITTNKPCMAVQTDAGTKTATSSLAVVANTWYHLAGVRYGNTMTIYVDGVAKGTADLTGRTVSNGVNRCSLAGYWTGAAWADNFFGWIDEVRIVKGAAMYTGNFAPTGPFGVGCSPMWWFFANKWKDFLRDLKAGLIPPDVLRQRYGDLMTI